MLSYRYYCKGYMLVNYTVQDINIATYNLQATQEVL